MSRQKERYRDGLKTFPVAGKRIAHLIPSEKVSSYTKETAHEVSRGRAVDEL